MPWGASQRDKGDLWGSSPEAVIDERSYQDWVEQLFPFKKANNSGKTNSGEEDPLFISLAWGLVDQMLLQVLLFFSTLALKQNMKWGERK